MTCDQASYIIALLMTTEAECEQLFLDYHPLVPRFPFEMKLVVARGGDALTRWECTHKAEMYRFSMAEGLVIFASSEMAVTFTVIARYLFTLGDLSDPVWTLRKLLHHRQPQRFTPPASCKNTIQYLHPHPRMLPDHSAVSLLFPGLRRWYGLRS